MPKKTILIATEDEGSGRIYLQKVAAEDAVRSRCSVSFPDHIGSNPKNVIEAAKSHSCDSDLPFDEVWLVFDTEGPQNKPRHNDARHAVEAARQLGFRTAVSNPCFEFWLILHFERFSRSIIDAKAACHILKKHMKEYHKGHDCYELVRHLLETARHNARQLFEERCDRNNGHPCDCHPCTELFRLMDSLLG